jgi:DNA-binding NarL/FixJ family response regulator
MKGLINIGIIESSDLLYEGLLNILLKKKPGLRFYRIDELDEFCKFDTQIPLDVVLLNSAQIQNRIKLFRTIKTQKPGTRWIGIAQSLLNNETISEFDEMIRIDDSEEEICKKVCSVADSKNLSDRLSPQKNLSDREIDVLKSLSKGLSNKEIADTLNISIHTVISHRKNLTQKTGIKSQSGLTIYAISNNIINIDSI